MDLTGLQSSQGSANRMITAPPITSTPQNLASMDSIMAMTPRATMLSIDAKFWGVLVMGRSEEHTSELQSHSDLVCRLLLEKKKIGEARTFTVATLEAEIDHPTDGQVTKVRIRIQCSSKDLAQNIKRRTICRVAPQARTNRR